MRDFSNYHIQSKDKMMADSESVFQMHLDGFEGFDVKVDNIQDKVIIRQHSNPLNEYKEDRELICKLTINIKKGSIIDLIEENETWLVISDVDTDKLLQYCKIQKSNNTLTFYKTQILRTLPCIIQTSGANYLGLDENKYISSPNGKYTVICPDLGYITKADMNLRFILKGSAYKIEGINNLSDGLIVLELVDDAIIPDDNLELGIANYFSNQQNPEPQPTTITVNLTPSNNTLTLGRTLELTAHAYVNGVEDTTRYFLFTVTNDDGSFNNYVTSNALGNVCALIASNTSTNAGKYVNVHVEILGSPTIFYDRKIKLVALL